MAVAAERKCRECGHDWMANEPMMAASRLCPNCGSDHTGIVIHVNLAVAVETSVALSAEAVAVERLEEIRTVAPTVRRLHVYEPTKDSPTWLGEVVDDEDGMVGAAPGDTEDEMLLNILEYLRVHGPGDEPEEPSPKLG